MPAMFTRSVAPFRRVRALRGDVLKTPARAGAALAASAD